MKESKLLTCSSYRHSPAEDSRHAVRGTTLSTSTSTTPKSKQGINVNRPYRQSRREAINTHTFSQVQHSHEQQPKSRPPSHTQLQANSTRKTPKANTPNQTPKPQIRLPRICPGFPRREKRILRPTRSRDFTSHMQANLQSPLQQQHTDSGRSLADVTFENAARNRRIFRCHSCPY